MKVYGLPEHLENKYAPDYRNFDFDAERKKGEDGIVELKQWLLENGFTGPNTGELVSFGVGDGYATYMFADAGRRSCLIHMNMGMYGEYHYNDVQFLPKAEILKRINQQKKMKAIFGGS